MDVPSPPGPPGLLYRVFLWGYGALLWCGKPLIWRYFRKRAERDADYGRYLEQRRGEGAAFDADVWVHAVSIGEMTSAEPFVRLCLAEGCRVLTTHATPAGRRRAEAVFADEIGEGRVAVRYAPVDLGRYWRRFHETYGPRVGVVMEMEFWPNMIEAARESGCPLCLANSQVPGKSFSRAKRLSRMFGHPVARVAAVFAKSEVMAERFRALGAERVVVLGETRFDIAPPDNQLRAGRIFRDGRKVLTMASVVQGEEAIFADLARALMKDDQPPLVIWVPRAPELFAATAERLRAQGFRVAKRSEAFDTELSQTTPIEDVQILVGDSLGEMFFYLAPSDAVLVGGGFTPKGAHNIIEPLSLGKPVLTGPEIWTIEYPAREAQVAGVLTIVESAGDLPEAARAAMTDGRAAAEAFHSSNRGASQRIFDTIRGTLER